MSARRERKVVTVVFAVGDALRDALVRPGRVVVRLVFGQDGEQVALAEDQHAVKELAAQGCGCRLFIRAGQSCGRDSRQAHRLLGWSAYLNAFRSRDGSSVQC